MLQYVTFIKPILRLKDKNGYSKGYRPDIEDSLSRFGISLTTGLDSSSMKPIGDGHLTSSPRSQIILAVSRATGQILKFCIQILVLLKKWV